MIYGEKTIKTTDIVIIFFKIHENFNPFNVFFIYVIKCLIIENVHNQNNIYLILWVIKKM